MRRTTAALLLLALAAGTAAGDTIYLKNGGKFEGKLVSESPTEVVFEVRGIGEQTFKRADVLKIERGETVLDEYDRRRAAIEEGDADAWFELGMWCREKGLRKEANASFEEAIAIDPEHEEARKALGYVRVGDQWLSPREAKRHREEQKKALAKALGGLKLVKEPVLDKEAGVSFRPPAGWKRCPVAGGLATEYRGPELHGVPLIIGYETAVADDVASFKEAVLMEVEAAAGDIRPETKTGAASLGARTVEAIVCRYGAEDAEVERRDLVLPRREDLLHVWLSFPAKEAATLRSFFAEVLATFKGGIKETGGLTYKLPGDDWEKGVGLPDGLAEAGFSLPRLPPGGEVIHNTMHPVVVYMERVEGGASRIHELSSGLLDVLRDQGASIQVDTEKIRKRKVAGEQASVIPFSGTLDRIFFEGYTCVFAKDADACRLMIVSFFRSMGPRYVIGDFNKLLDKLKL